MGYIMLKLLNRVLIEGDSIRAVVRNTASKQDDKTPGTTLPSLSTQQSLILGAYDKVG
jgi:acyl transferase domain-containing protein